MSPRSLAQALARRMCALPDRHGRWVLAAMALIVAAGFALRADAALNPLEEPGDDARAYFSLSKSLYEEGSYGGESFRDADDWSPGAPLLYAGVHYATGGVRDNAARLLVALLGTAAIIVAYLLGRRLGCRPAGLVAAAGVAFYPSFIHSTGALLSEGPALLWLPAAVLALLWAAERDRAAVWLVPGLLLGLLALTRPEYLFVGLALVAAVLAHGARERGWRPAGLAAGAMVIAFLAPIVPWTVRNLIELDRFVPVSTGSGKALYVGSHLPADGDYQRVKAILAERYLGRQLEPGSEALDRVDPTPLFDRVAARHPEQPRDSALARIGRESLLDNLGDRPLDYTAMLVRKTGRMWGSGVGETMESGPGRLVQKLLVVLGLCGLGVLAWRRRWWAVTVVGTPLIVVTVIGALTLASTRRNEILMTLVFPLAGVALARAGGHILGRR